MLVKNTLPFLVRQFEFSQPEKIAVAAGENSVSYSQLNSFIDNCAANLKNFGVNAGDFVAVSALMKPEYIAAFLAVKELRAVAVPIGKIASPAEADEIISRVNAKIFLSDNPQYKTAKSLRDFCRDSTKNFYARPDENSQIPDEEITEILFTSGTTGKPKGVMLSQRAISASIFNTATGIDMKNSDVLLLPLPLNHSYGLRVMRAALSLGETIILQNGFSFARETVRNIQEWRCNCAAFVNAGYEMLREQLSGGGGINFSEHFAHMRYIEFGAGHVPEKTRRELREALPNTRLHNTWGSTETGGGLFIEFSSCDDARMSSAGKAINNIQAKIIDGRLALKTSAMLTGYFQDDELTQKTIKDGWLLTNDIAEIDVDGYIFLHGRIDDIISVGGEKVSPFDIERIILSQPEISECACIGVDDKVLGQKPVAFIAGNFDAKKLDEAVRKSGNALMIPSEYIKVENLPRNEAGKVDRKKLREIFYASKQNNNDFLNVILTRRSVRTFTDEPIEKNLLEKILLAGRLAPTGHNMQTWRFTVLTSQEKILHLREIAKATAAKKKTLFYGFNNPQALIIISNDRRNPDGIMDASAAAENILLAAHALKLGACWISALRFISDEPEIREILNDLKIPESHIAYISIGIGHPAGLPKMPVKKENVIYFAD